MDKKGIFPQVYELETMEDEVDIVVKTLMEIIAKEPQYSYKDFAILARANNHLDPFLLALRKSEIPYQLVGSRGLYDRDEIRNIIALLRVIVNPDDGISLYRAKLKGKQNEKSKCTTVFDVRPSLNHSFNCFWF